ncbi:hypothetical protein BDF14DRAFT_1767719 [Spinellus fusiger]|nr:hypothetical protein BDF14DRAFT_1767719 [Spinellus fusiger]
MTSPHPQPQWIRYEGQVAGHDRLLQLDTNDVMVIKPCHATELVFYEEAQAYPTFYTWIPECYGTLRASTPAEQQLLTTAPQESVVSLPGTPSLPPLDSQNNTENHICLENLLRGFTRPCVLDLKLGKTLYDSRANEAKKAKMQLNAQNTTTESMGLRVSGMKVYDATEDVYHIYKKSFGRSLTQETLPDAFMAFLCPFSHTPSNTGLFETVPNSNPSKNRPLPKNKREWIVDRYISDLVEMQDWIANTPHLEMIGSSLLFVYEGDPEAADKAWKRMLQESKSSEASISSSKDSSDRDDPEEAPLEEESPEEDTYLCDLRLIDFGHAQWQSQQTEQDKGLLEGLNHAIQLLKDCLLKLD